MHTHARTTGSRGGAGIGVPGTHSHRPGSRAGGGMKGAGDQRPARWAHCRCRCSRCCCWCWCCGAGERAACGEGRSGCMCVWVRGRVWICLCVRVCVCVGMHLHHRRRRGEQRARVRGQRGRRGTYGDGSDCCAAWSGGACAAGAEAAMKECSVDIWRGGVVLVLYPTTATDGPCALAGDGSVRAPGQGASR